MTCADGDLVLNDPRRYWLGFNLVKGMGSVRLRQLLDHFGGIEAAWNAPAEMLYATGLSPKLVENLLQVRTEVSLDQLWERLQAAGAQVIIWDDEGYPKRLLEIDQPPPVLYVRGEVLPEDDWAVAIVGTRRITAYGRQIADRIAGFLARNGITVISGLARGVDAAAHKTALESGGRTIAVLGSGVDRIYPPEHRKLAEAIIKNGAVISDYALGTPPDAMNFPPRNRIISGLAQAVVIVEAGERSGALITARFAADQGRDVFSVPGNINAPNSAGTNRLIQQGAHPLVDPQEILEVLNLTMISQHQTARAVLPADKTEARLLHIVSQEPVHVDEICNHASLPIKTDTATLAMMELKGMVRQVGGMHYIAIRELPDAYEVSEGE